MDDRTSRATGHSSSRLPDVYDESGIGSSLPPSHTYKVASQPHSGFSMRATTGIEQGDHVCALYSDQEEQLALALDYVSGGLDRGERCLYICGERSVSEFRDALKSSGIDVEREESRGTLTLRSSRDGYLPGGVFDPDEMIGFLDQIVQEALDSGYSGLCSAGDMTWLVDHPAGAERLAEYEVRLNEFVRSHMAHIRCFYNRRTLPASCIDDALATHRYLLMPGALLMENMFHEPDHQAGFRDPASPDVLSEKLDILDATRIAMRAGAPLPTRLH